MSGEQKPSATQGGDSGGTATAPEHSAEIPPAVKAYFDQAMAGLREDMNRVVSSTVHQRVQRALKDAQKTDAETDTDDSQGDAAGNGDGDLSKRFERLQRELQAERAERERLKDESATATREAELRKLCEEHGASNPEAAFRFLIRDLEVEDGAFVRKGDNGLTTPVGDYVKQTIQSHDWMQAASGRQGGGSAGATRAAGGGLAKLPDDASPEDRLAHAFEQSAPEG